MADTILNANFLLVQASLASEGYAIDPERVDVTNFASVEALTPLPELSEATAQYFNHIKTQYLVSHQNITPELQKALPIAVLLSSKELLTLTDRDPETRPASDTTIPDYLVPVSFVADIGHISLDTPVMISDELKADDVAQYIRQVTLMAAFDLEGKIISGSIIPVVRNSAHENYSADAFGIATDLEQMKNKISNTPYAYFADGGDIQLSADPDDGKNAVASYQAARTAEIAAYEAAHYDNSELLKLHLYAGAGLAVGAIAGLTLAAATTVTWPLAYVALAGGIGCAFGDVGFQVLDQGKTLNNIDKEEALIAGIIGSCILVSAGSLIEVGANVGRQYAAANGFGQTAGVLAKGLGSMFSNGVLPKLSTSNAGWMRAAAWVGRTFYEI